MTLSVIIPTLNAATTLGATLISLDAVPEVIVVDGGSSDTTCALARQAGARVVASEKGRGCQLATGADAASGDWFLFLHADTTLEGGWRRVVDAFTGDPANERRAAAFRFALDDASPQAKRLERQVAWRAGTLGLPYGDQGLLISRDFYQTLGGFRALPLMEDVDMVRRIGRRRLIMLPVAARTSAKRWRDEGWVNRSLRNVTCLSLYSLGVPPRLLQWIYGR